MRDLNSKRMEEKKNKCIIERIPLKRQEEMKWQAIPHVSSNQTHHKK